MRSTLLSLAFSTASEIFRTFPARSPTVLLIWAKASRRVRIELQNKTPCNQGVTARTPLSLKKWRLLRVEKTPLSSYRFPEPEIESFLSHLEGDVKKIYASPFPDRPLQNSPFIYSKYGVTLAKRVGSIFPNRTQADVFLALLTHRKTLC